MGQAVCHDRTGQKPLGTLMPDNIGKHNQPLFSV
jgi:hypothetical protein